MRKAIVLLSLLFAACSLEENELGHVDAESVARLIAWIDAQELAGVAEVELILDSPGGDVDSGFELIRRIEAAKLPIRCIVNYQAQSMAFAILQSCTVRAMGTAAFLMAHQAHLTSSSGNPEWDAEDLAYMNEALAVQCSKRLNVTIETFRERVANGRKWYLYSHQALSVGAVDRIFPTGAF